MQNNMYKIFVGGLSSFFFTWQFLFIFLPIINLFWSGLYFSNLLSHVKWLIQFPFFSIIASSFFHAFISATICIVIAFFVVYNIYFLSLKNQKTLLLLFCIPFINNFFLHIASWANLLSFNGPLNNILIWLGIIKSPIYFMYTQYATILVTVYINMPFAIIPMYIAFDRFNYQLIEASADLGSSMVSTIRRIILPGVSAGIVNGFFLVFIPTCSEFAVTELIGGDKILSIGSLFSFLILSNSLFEETSIAILFFGLALILFSIFLHNLINYSIKILGR